MLLVISCSQSNRNNIQTVIIFNPTKFFGKDSQSYFNQMSYLHCPSFFHEAIITDFCLRLYFEQTLCGSRLIPPKEFIRLAWLHCTPLPLSYPECFSSGERSSTCDVSGWRTDLPIRSRSPSRSYFHHKSRKKEKKEKKTRTTSFPSRGRFRLDGFQVENISLQCRLVPSRPPLFGVVYQMSDSVPLLHRLSPYEWITSFPCREEEEKSMENQFSLNNSLWFTMGSLLQQGTDQQPK